MRQGDEARQAVADARRRTTDRRHLARHKAFARVSPRVGELDSEALDEAMASDADDALGMLIDLGSATDPALRELARRLAGRILVNLGRAGPPKSAGVGRLHRANASTGGDLDIDASLDELVAARAGGRSAALGDLWARRWARPSSALCLLIDRSGSMGGRRVATAALAAAAVAFRAPDDYSVLAFADDVIVVKAQNEDRPVEQVVDDLLALRGHGTTDLALALRAAGDQLAGSAATQRAALLLSDGRGTAGEPPDAAARRLERLLVLAPSDDSCDARALAAAVGAGFAEVAGPTDVPAALAALMGG